MFALQGTIKRQVVLDNGPSSLVAASTWMEALAFVYSACRRCPW